MSSTLTIIPLGTAYLEAPYISSEIIEVIRDNKSSGKGTLVFYSRRGNARAWICEDCGHYERCPHCDIALAYHTSPTKRLICHQCGTIAPFPIVCGICGSSHVSPLGVGIQQIEEHLHSIVGPSYSILRVDQDNSDKPLEVYSQIQHNNIILATQSGSTIVHPHIQSVIWLSFELNLSIASYHIEEEIFDEITYYKKQSLPLYIQTYTPEHPLLYAIMSGNIKDYMHTLSRERKQFGYPPYGQVASIRIHSERRYIVDDMLQRIQNKIALMDPASLGVFVGVDTTSMERLGGEWQKKILLKGSNISVILKNLEVEIVRNRCVTLDWI